MGLRRRGRIAHQVSKMGDIEQTPWGNTDRERVLDATEEAQLAGADSTIQKMASRPARKLRIIDNQMQAGDEKLARRRAALRPKVENAESWRRLGIFDDLPTLDAPRPVRWLVLALLAGVDFYIFALAIAKSDDVEPNLTNPAFLGGGLLGLIVFAFGYLLAHALKHALYTRAQAAILDERGDEFFDAVGVDRNRLFAGRPQWVVIGVTGGLFALMVGLAGMVRWEALKPGESAMVAWLQALVPILAMAVECYMYDPSEVDEPGRSLTSRWLQYRHDHWEERLDTLETRRMADRAEIQRRMDIERAIMRVEQTDLGLGAPEDDAARPFTPPPRPAPGWRPAEGGL